MYLSPQALAGSVRGSGSNRIWLGVVMVWTYESECDGWIKLGVVMVCSRVGVVEGIYMYNSSSPAHIYIYNLKKKKAHLRRPPTTKGEGSRIAAAHHHCRRRCCMLCVVGWMTGRSVAIRPMDPSMHTHTYTYTNAPHAAPPIRGEERRRVQDDAVVGKPKREPHDPEAERGPTEGRVEKAGQGG